MPSRPYPAVELHGRGGFGLSVVLQGGPGLPAGAPFAPQVSCSVHCVPPGRRSLQRLQQEGGLIHSEKATAEREGRRQAGDTGRTRADPSTALGVPVICVPSLELFSAGLEESRSSRRWLCPWLGVGLNEL